MISTRSSRKRSPSTGPFSDTLNPQQNAFIESLNGSLRDECLKDEIFDSLANAGRTLALWR